jgi:hypothetical protein
MKVTLESTSKIVTLATPDGSIPTRIWEGVTDKGIEVYAHVAHLHSTHLNQDWLLKEEQGDETAPHREPSPLVLALVDGSGE